MRGVILDADSLGQDVDLTPLLRQLEDWDIFGHTSAADLRSRCRDADVILTNKVRLDRKLLQQLKSLKLICVMATGVNNVDLDAAREAGIQVSNVNDYATASVVQHTICLLLNLVTRMPHYIRLVQEGAWQKASVFCLVEPTITELHGKRLGIVGYGNLGRRVARVAEALGMQILVSARPNTGTVPEGRLPFPEVLAASDLLSLHCPLTRDTRHLICEATIALMPRGAYLINTARGGLVDSAAVIRALDSGQLGGAAIDVLDEEPPGEHEPLLARVHDKLLVTPHNAWASRESRQRLVDQLAANLQAFKAGQTHNQVNSGSVTSS